MSTRLDLSGKVALITGGNGGIGFGIAKGLLDAGASIAIAGRDKTKTQNAEKILLKSSSNVVGLEVDVSDEGSVFSLVSETVKLLGPVDILVNNAGIAIRKPPQEYTVDEWDKVLDINLKGVFLCSKAVYPSMLGREGGSIINIGSMTSIFGSDWVSSYSASKGGVVQLTRSLALAWAKDQIRVNAILPGWIKTELTSAYWTNPENRDRFEFINKRIPNGRWGKPEDLSGLAVFLASETSNYVTGTAIPVDGGYSSY